MLCEKCNKNIANVYLKNSVNGNVTESHLCSECAGELYGKGYMGLQNGDLKSDILNMLNFGKLAAIASSGAKNRSCPMCEVSLSEIMKSGKAGCGKCYETFRDELSPSIAKIHGSAEHIGKIPKNMQSRITARKKLEELGAKMKKAVSEQNFEEAAVLRDEINKINRESEEGNIQ